MALRAEGTGRRGLSPHLATRTSSDERSRLDAVAVSTTLSSAAHVGATTNARACGALGAPWTGKGAPAARCPRGAHSPGRSCEEKLLAMSALLRNPMA